MVRTCLSYKSWIWNFAILVVWWLGFLFRWRTQQSAITGMNCRITQLPNLWTQKAPGRNLPKAIPVHAASLSVEQKLPTTRGASLRGDVVVHPWVEMKWKRVLCFWMCRVTAGDPQRRWCQAHSNRRPLSARKVGWRRARYSMINPMLCWESKITHNHCALFLWLDSHNFSLSKTYFFNFTHRPECGRTTRRT